MKNPKKDEIFLTVNNFLLRFENGFPFTIPFNLSPKCEVSCDPDAGIVELRIFTKVQKLITVQKKEILIKCENIGKKPSILVQLKKKELYEEFYAVCLQIIEKIQIQRRNPTCAINSVFTNYEDLFKEKKEIPEQKIIGLWGELYFIYQNLLWKKGDKIIEQWFGPSDEEHDFVTKKQDYEIKTTKNERRIHTISSLSQLQAKPKRKLFVISIQITNSTQLIGDSVTSLIHKIKQKIKEVQNKELFNDKLKSLNVDKMNQDIINRKFILRNKITSSLVDSSFPKITFERLQDKKAVKSRIIDCLYKINVETLGVELTRDTYV